jgi:hypothetical protein
MLSLQNWRTLMVLAAFWPSLAVADDQRGALDPRVTQNNIQQTICRRGWVRTVRPSAEFANTVKRRMMVEQGWENAADVELDHIVPLELGGAARDLKNLWLQPLRGPWNVHCKMRSPLSFPRPFARAMRNSPTHRTRSAGIGERLIGAGSIRTVVSRARRLRRSKFSQPSLLTGSPQVSQMLSTSCRCQRNIFRSLPSYWTAVVDVDRAAARCSQIPEFLVPPLARPGLEWTGRISSRAPCRFANGQALRASLAPK